MPEIDRIDDSPASGSLDVLLQPPDQGLLSSMAAALTALVADPNLHSGDLPRFAQRVCLAISQLAGISDAVVYLFDQARGVAVPIGFESCRRLELEAAGVLGELALADYPDYTQASLSGRCLYATDVATAPWYGAFYADVLQPLQVLSLADVPILADATVKGTLSVAGTDKPVLWDSSWQSFLQAAAQLIGQCYLAGDRARKSVLVEHSERLLADAQELAHLGSWRAELQPKSLWWSTRCFQLLGESPESFTPSLENFIERVHQEDREAYETRWRLAIAGEARHHDCEYRVRHRAGHWRTLRERGRVVRNPEGQVSSIWGCSQDVTEERELQQRVLRDLTQDRLTGLMNRPGLEKALNGVWPQLVQNHSTLTLALIDLVDFSDINWSLGASAGDRVLSEIGRRLHTLGGSSLVARLSGDVFAMVFLQTDQEVIFSHLTTVMTQVAYPVEIGDANIKLFARVGFASAPIHGRELSTTLAAAELALMKAKSSFANLPVGFREEFREQAAHQFGLVSKMHAGLLRGEFSVHYQPVVRSDGGDVVGAEALLRWCHEGQWIPPAAFIPTAEVAGLINDLGAFLVEQVTMQISAWRRDGWVVPRISMNVSPRQLVDPKLMETLDACLERHGVHAADIAIELTESGSVADIQSSREFMLNLRQRGIATCIDDFGTGLSSMQYLAELPLSVLKIDRSFVKKLHSNEGKYRSLVAGMIDMAHQIGLKVVAEGVEYGWQREFLAECRCDYVQGYLIGRPASADEFRRWLDEAPAAGRQAR